MLSGKSLMLQVGGQNQKWPTNGPSGHITPTVRGVPNVAKQGTKSGVAHKWAGWLYNPCRLGVPNTSERGTKSEVAHKWAQWLPNPCHLERSLMLESGEQNQKWHTNGPSGYITPAIWGVPYASEQGTVSKVAQKWPKISEI